MPDEFEVGERIIVYIPDEEVRDDIERFNAGWDEGMDEIANGTAAVILQAGEDRCGRPDYLLKFPNGDTWWWDPNFMDHAEPKCVSTVSDEDFDAVLN